MIIIIISSERPTTEFLKNEKHAVFSAPTPYLLAGWRQWVKARGRLLDAFPGAA